LGSARDVGLEISDPQVVKMKQRRLTHKKPPISASRRPIWMELRVISRRGTWRKWIKMFRGHKILWVRCFQDGGELGVKMPWLLAFVQAVRGEAECESELEATICNARARWKWQTVFFLRSITMTYCGHSVSHLNITVWEVDSNFTSRVTNSCVKK